MRKRKILVFGGAFNPVTVAHEAIISACLGLPRFREVWVMPSGNRTDKQMDTTDKQRLAMLELVRRERFDSSPRLIVSDFELQLPRPSATYKTLTALTEAYPRYEFWFAFGVDSYMAMPLWPHGDELRQILTKLVLFARSADDHIMGNDIINLTLPLSMRSVSSTDVRRSLADGRGGQQDVSEPVLTYIRQQKLYRRPKKEEILPS